jgi:hypothetical protein
VAKLVIDTPEWFPREGTGALPDPANVRVNKFNISIHPKAWEWMGKPERLEAGLSRYKDEMILTLRPSKKGHLLIRTKTSTRLSIISCGLVEHLRHRGLRQGEYELCRAKKAGIFVAIPVGVLE